MDAESVWIATACVAAGTACVLGILVAGLRADNRQLADRNEGLRLLLARKAAEIAALKAAAEPARDWNDPDVLPWPFPFPERGDGTRGGA